LILFCDTSALIKLYLQEPFSPELKALMTECENIVISRIAWAEAFAALSRRAREQPADASTIALAKSAIQRDWPHYLVLEVNQSVVEQAGEFADAFALRGYDAVQLASAAYVLNVAKTQVTFACFDARLSKAARLLGMQAPFPAF
jgi:predicted nucleic acid-binding protein